MNRSTRGFSLMELLVVLAIISAVIAIAFPAFAKYRETAMMSQCQAFVRQIGLGCANYAAANADRIPNYAVNAAPYDNRWANVLAGYMGLVDGEDVVGKTRLGCPAYVPPTVGTGTNRLSYGVNFPGVFARAPVTPPATPDVNLSGGARMGNLPSSVFLAADVLNPVDEPSSAVFHPGLYPLTDDFDGDGVADSNFSLFRYNGFDPRHGAKGGDMVFADLSTRVVSVSEWLADQGGMWGADDLSYK
ncbi:MAG: prepilin-type N-terminal cleavage/methylation domain-containing protein [Planctomycetota bacterium]|nr:prepilin-type N-terminal cleavage/methylation domain-containing protein [Planctomycetota bacterium]